MGMKEKDVRIRLASIVSRRNQIVHEADIHAQTGLKNPITDNYVRDSIEFIEKLGNVIFKCVQIE